MNLLKEPLLHFLAAGGVLFAAYAWLGRDQDPAPGTAAGAKKVLEELSKPGAPQRAPELGDRFLLQHDFPDCRAQVAADLFGGDFARAVLALEPGAWQGPIESGYGLHLVRVWEARPARWRDFPEARDDVLKLWQEERRKAADEKYFALLLEIRSRRG